MSDTAALERWYRRMLTWYPAEHRRAYGEEMIGVLLASAPEGRRRPTIADTLDLIKGGLLARLRPADADADTDVGWRDTCAVFSIAAPVAALVYCVAFTAVNWVGALLGGSLAPILTKGSPLPILLITLAIVPSIAIPPLLASAPRLWWLAITAAAVPAIVVGYETIRHLQFADSRVVWYSIFFVLELVALAISPGPRRGAAIMTRPTWAITVGSAGLTGLAMASEYQIATLVPLIVTMLVVMAAVVIGLVLMLPAPIGARLLLLLAIPGYPAAIALTGDVEFQFFGWVSPWSLSHLYLPTIALYLPTIALVGLVAALAWRSGHRGSAAS